MVKDLISLTGDSEGASSNSSKAIIFNIVHFLLFLVFDYFFPLWLVLLCSHCLSFKALRGFCDNVFLVIQFVQF